MADKKKKEVILLKGIGVSPGITIGRAYLLERGMYEPDYFCYLDPSDSEKEVARFERALAVSKEQLERIRDKMVSEGRGAEHIGIIDAHLMILQDQMLTNDTVRVIKEERVNAEWALKKVLAGLKDFFSRMDDEYFKERIFDIEHIVNRLIMNLMGRKHESISDLREPFIVVAHDISPTDTAQMKKDLVLGFLTEVGGRTSHSAIMSRALEIPAVVGLDAITRRVETGDIVIVDGTTGTVIINPSTSVIAVYKKRKERYENYGRSLFLYKDMPSETSDGRRVGLMGNMEIIDELDSLREHGAEGIGLYRTEFLYLNRDDLPTEDEHVAAYHEVIEKMAPHPVIIRTLDVGGDKLASHMDHPEEPNPAMGLRAIRYCLKNLDVFKTQLRGILRASTAGKVKVMFPMISGMDEVRRAKKLLEEAKEELASEGRPFDPDIEVGVMIEIPSAAIIADLIVREVDFISIGTNDLLQYALAIDRVNEHVAYLYEPFHPAVIRMIKSVIEAANDAGISVGVCGEMAGEPEYAFILLGFGVTTLSMNAFSILKVKSLLRSVSYAEAREVCEKIVDLDTASSVESYISSKLPELYKGELWS
ncbi:MAG: phosphoenolpyruvate--protein phosphotransferase [Thermodesulfobacteriota bacterium]